MTRLFGTTVLLLALALSVRAWWLLASWGVVPVIIAIAAGLLIPLGIVVGADLAFGGRPWERQR